MVFKKLFLSIFYHRQGGNIHQLQVLDFSLFLSLSLFFWPPHVDCGILVPQPGIELGPSAVRGWSLSHWTTREFLT